MIVNEVMIFFCIYFEISSINWRNVYLRLSLPYFVDFVYIHKKFMSKLKHTFQLVHAFLCKAVHNVFSFTNISIYYIYNAYYVIPRQPQ